MRRGENLGRNDTSWKVLRPRQSVELLRNPGVPYLALFWVAACLVGTTITILAHQGARLLCAWTVITMDLIAFVDLATAHRPCRASRLSRTPQNIHLVGQV
jgi:hypothetical protein